MLSFFFILPTIYFKPKYGVLRKLKGSSGLNWPNKRLRSSTWHFFRHVFNTLNVYAEVVLLEFNQFEWNLIHAEVATYHSSTYPSWKLIVFEPSSHCYLLDPSNWVANVEASTMLELYYFTFEVPHFNRVESILWFVWIFERPWIATVSFSSEIIELLSWHRK